jgi:hypothetical protein
LAEDDDGTLSITVKKGEEESEERNGVENRAEMRILSRVDDNRLQAFRMWEWGRMEKVRWTEIRTNEEVLDVVGVEVC